MGSKKKSIEVLVGSVVGFLLGCCFIYLVQMVSDPNEEMLDTVAIKTMPETSISYDDSKITWRKEVGIIRERLASKPVTDEEIKNYEVSVELLSIKKEIDMPISPIEYKVLKEDDLVDLLVIYDRKTGEIEEAQWIRDEEGRLTIHDLRPVVVVDPGHGGMDSGAGSNGYWLEKDLNLKISLRMKELLEEEDIRVIMTRDTDEFISLYDRIAILNYVQGSMMVSNHLNRKNTKASGVEVLYSQYSDKEFANTLAAGTATEQHQVYSVYNRRNGRLPELDYYFIHNYTKQPSYILEYGFSDNEKDSQYIMNNWESLVIGASKTIVEYLNNEEQVN